MTYLGQNLLAHSATLPKRRAPILAPSVRFTQKLRQLGDVCRDPSRVVAQDAGNKAWCTGVLSGGE